MQETPAAEHEHDRALVKQCLEGQGDAFRGLVNRYNRPLFNVALRMLGNVQDAEDVTQTVFLNAFLKLQTYNPRYKFFSWVYRMTVNESLNTLKRRKPTEGLDNEFDLRTPLAAPVSAVELEDRVGKALMSLRPDDRAIVVLKHFASFSYQEIAEVLEIPVNKVKSRLFTARERLRDVLREGER